MLLNDWEYDETVAKEKAYNAHNSKRWRNLLSLLQESFSDIDENIKQQRIIKER